MLVLSRKTGERILIGDKITITVVRISGGGVRIGIEAPEELAVVREELQNDSNQSHGNHLNHGKNSNHSGASRKDSSGNHRQDSLNHAKGQSLSNDSSSPNNSLKDPTIPTNQDVSSTDKPSHLPRKPR